MKENDQYKITFSENAIKELERFKERLGATSIAETIEISVSIAIYLNNMLNEGKKIIIKGTNGYTEELVKLK